VKIAIVSSLLAGGVGVSIAEHFLKFNLVDRVLNFYRTTEQRLALLEERSAEAAKVFRNAVEQRVIALEKAVKK
jgi:hypothetical protein